MSEQVEGVEEKVYLHELATAGYYNSVEYAAGKENAGPVVIFCFTKWAKPCTQFRPLVEKMAAKWTNAKFFELDMDKYAGVVEARGVDGVPCIAIFKQEHAKDVTRVKSDLVYGYIPEGTFDQIMERAMEPPPKRKEVVF